ncbi:hypothetical protein [Streptomyces sp. CRN 30]|uniref:hypothetical protein n=1 Tax=Streptomyces sp. CRN 30 TaxID=3075613 RepID=UPI002A81B59A|nr:hypothetical protein [Streptomyces sp. CRN 30]
MTTTRTATTAAQLRSTDRAVARGFGVFTGTVGVLVAAWLLLFSLPGALDRERDFRAAAACAPAGGDDCLSTVPARIDRAVPVKPSPRGGPWTWMHLTEADGTTSRTRLEGSANRWPAARAEQRVDVTYWRGQIRYVDFESERRYTSADVRGDYRLYLAWGLVSGTLGVLSLILLYWGTRLTRASGRARPWLVGTPVLGGFLLTGIGTAATFATDSAGAALQVVGVSAAVLLAVCGVVAVVSARRSRGDDTVVMQPSVPTTELVLPVTIVGEVPYAGEGGHLVVGPVGPAHLSAAPDWTGVAARREVPQTLTPIRVRPPYWSDFEHIDDGRKCLVLECEDKGEGEGEDEGVRVLIVTHRKHMPWLLGALRSAPTG